MRQTVGEAGDMQPGMSEGGGIRRRESRDHDRALGQSLR
jgi:hypothetical protein